MKQHVNLRLVDFDAARPRLAAAQLAKVGLGAAAFGLVLWGAAEWRNQSLETRVESLRAQRAAESGRVVELAGLYPPRPVNAALEAQVSGLGRERAAKRRLLGLLSSESLGNTRGFSRHVAGIARQRVEGVWLRHVRIEAGGLELVLEGAALDAALVPRFLRALGEEAAFAGSEFRALRIERSGEDAQRVDWSARTRDDVLGPVTGVLR